MKRGKKNLLIGLLASALVIIACFWPSSGPKYRGRTASDWMEWALVPANSGSVYFRPENDEAVQALGTNALPVMIKFIGAKDSAFKTTFHQLLLKQTLIRYRMPRPVDQRIHALRAFGTLGEIARPAVPELTAMLSDPELAPYVLSALHEIGPPDELAAGPLVEKLVALMSDPQLKDRALWLLGEMGPAAATAVPMLVKDLESVKSGSRCSTILALGKIGSHADLTIPALTDCLRDTNSGVRLQVMSALEKFGPRAKAAIPQLRVLCEENSPAPETAGDPFIPVFSLNFIGGPSIVPLGTYAKRALVLIDRESVAPNSREKAARSSTGE